MQGGDGGDQENVGHHHPHQHDRGAISVLRCGLLGRFADHRLALLTLSCQLKSYHGSHGDQEAHRDHGVDGEAAQQKGAKATDLGRVFLVVDVRVTDAVLGDLGGVAPHRGVGQDDDVDCQDQDQGHTLGADHLGLEGEPHRHEALPTDEDQEPRGGHFGCFENDKEGFTPDV